MDTNKETNGMSMLEFIDNLIGSLDETCKDEPAETAAEDRSCVCFTSYAKGKKVVDVVTFLARATHIETAKISYDGMMTIECSAECFSNLSFLNDYETSECYIRPEDYSLNILICKKAPAKPDPKKKSSKR